MAPVLSSGNYDYDYDTVQPYFLDGEEEDFYLPPRSQLLPGPSEDIWKKFELLPTPPLSPSRRPSLSAAEHLEAVSDLLDEECNPSAALLQSFIIQDCMWSSSFAAATELERVVSQRLASLQTRQASSTANSGTTTLEGSADQQVGSSQANTRCLQDLYSTAAECVDPSVVFAHSTLSGDGAAASEMSLDSPPISSSDSESGEEEGEEVDVVTVDRRKAGHRPDASPLVLKRSHINVHQHNYAAHQPAASKRLKSQSGRRCCSPRSDEEDSGDRRRTHNVLERQRRSELRMSFLALRDQIPAVADNDKTAKVVILKKATELIWQMREDERTLLRTKDELRKRSRELRHRLEQLKTSL